MVSKRDYEPAWENGRKGEIQRKRYRQTERQKQTYKQKMRERRNRRNMVCWTEKKVDLPTFWKRQLFCLSIWIISTYLMSISWPYELQQRKEHTIPPHLGWWICLLFLLRQYSLTFYHVLVCTKKKYPCMETALDEEFLFLTLIILHKTVIVKPYLGWNAYFC